MIGDDGKLIDIKDFSKIGYVIMVLLNILSSLKAFIKKYNLSNVRSTNIHDNTSFQFYTEFSNIEENKCNFFYNNFIMKKFQKSFVKRVKYR